MKILNIISYHLKIERVNMEKKQRTTFLEFIFMRKKSTWRRFGIGNFIFKHTGVLTLLMPYLR